MVRQPQLRLGGETEAVADRIRLFVVDSIPTGPENLLTHFFFGVLSELYDRDPTVIRDFLVHAGVKEAAAWSTDDVSISEQVRQADGEGRAILDVTISRSGKFYVVVEAKLGAPLNPEQLQKYARHAESRGEPWWVLSVTANASDALEVARIGNPRITHTTWQKLYRFVEGLTLPSELRLLREYLLQLMDERGLKPVKIEWQSTNDLMNTVGTAWQLKRTLWDLLHLIVAHLPREYERVGIDRWEEWLLQYREGLRYRLRVLTSRKAYGHDSHIRVDPFQRRVEYCFYPAIRGWDKGRSRPAYEYLKEAVSALADFAQSAAAGSGAAEVLGYGVSVGRWDEPAWNGTVGRAQELASELSRLLPEARWEHPNAEMVITHATSLAAAVGKGPEWWPPDRPLKLEPEEVETLAEGVATGFVEFVETLRPYWSRLDCT